MLATARFRRARSFGFTGKAAIHPKHLPICNRVFSPSDDEIAWSQAVIAAFAAAKAFGAFQALVADLPGGRLVETIPNFHHTPSRFANFQAALAKDAHGRAAAARPEIAFALARALPRETQIIGMDFCAPMLAQAEARQSASQARYANVVFQQGDGLALPLLDARQAMSLVQEVSRAGRYPRIIGGDALFLKAFAVLGG